MRQRCGWRVCAALLLCGTATAPMAAGDPAATISAARPFAQTSGSERSVRDGVFTADQASRGRRTFQVVCAACHSIAEHTGGRFASRWANSTLGDLFDVVSTTMPESEPGSLTPEEYAGVLAFFLDASGYPEGTEDLPADTTVLGTIRIEPPKP